MEAACTKVHLPQGQRCSLYARQTQGQEHRTSFWRPWLITAADGGPQGRRTLPQSAQPSVRTPGTDCAAQEEKLLPGFNHPVRLFWPKSKSFDYLYSSGEMLLKNFPVQATINFYEESDSEDEDCEDETEEEEDEEVEQAMDSKLRNPMECVKPMSSINLSSSAYHCLN